MWLHRVLGKVSVDVVDELWADWGVENLWEFDSAGLLAFEREDVHGLARHC